MGNLCIIPARGGSKRIPKKNIKDFAGKPIIAYSIDAALKSDLFDEVMVSTDDEEVAEISQEYGAVVPFMRSDENSDDFSTTTDALVEVLEEYQNRGLDFKYCCCIYPTAPLLKVSYLHDAFKLMYEKKHDSIFSITEFDYPILRSLRFDDDQTVKMNWPEFLNSRSQDLPKSYHDAGQFYLLDVGSFMTNRVLFSDNSGAIVLSSMEVQDIDTENDWKLAEMKAKFS